MPDLWDLDVGDRVEKEGVLLDEWEVVDVEEREGFDEPYRKVTLESTDTAVGSEGPARTTLRSDDSKFEREFSVPADRPLGGGEGVDFDDSLDELRRAGTDGRNPELVVQTTDPNPIRDRDYSPPKRGELLRVERDDRDEERELAYYETPSGEERRINVAYLVGDADARAGLVDRQGRGVQRFVNELRAHRDHQERSPRAQRTDERLQAEETTNYDRWKRNKDSLDFPGVDDPRLDVE